jgi:hypothetical protein
MPLIISTMAYQGGRNVADPSKPCNLVQPCMVKLGTSDVSPSSYTLYVTAIAVLIQVYAMKICDLEAYVGSNQCISGYYIYPTWSCC